MMAQRMDRERLYKSYAAFGFGRATGIQLPGESSGNLRPLNRWSVYSIDSLAQGYEVMVTPLQMARAFAVFGNDGRLPDINLVKGKLDSEGNIVSTNHRRSWEELPQVVRPESAATMRRILADVPVRGTAVASQRSVPNWHVWNVFGKTGTSHISEGRAGYSDTRFNATFIGGAPMEDPRIIVAFTVHEPDRSLGNQGGRVASPSAISIMARSLEYMQVPPSPELTPPPQEIIANLSNYNPNVYRKPQQQANARNVSSSQ